MFSCISLLYEHGPLASLMSGPEVDLTNNMTWFLLSRGLQSPRRDKHVNKSLLHCISQSSLKK